MNNIYSHRSYRLYQSSYDEDGKGSVLAINADPYGIPVTYTGYALLFISLVWMLFDPKGGYRRLLKSPLLKKGALITALILSMGNIQTLHAESATSNLQMQYCQRKLQRSLASFIFSTTTASVRYRPLPSISARRYMEPGAIWD